MRATSFNISVRGSEHIVHIQECVVSEGHLTVTVSDEAFRLGTTTADFQTAEFAKDFIIGYLQLSNAEEQCIRPLGLVERLVRCSANA